MILADTDVQIDYLHGQGEAAAVESCLSSGSLRTTVITRFELLSGAKTPKQLGRVRQLLDGIPSLDLDDPAADMASEIRARLSASAPPSAWRTASLPGIVLSAGGELLTRSRRHFERIPGLRLVLGRKQRRLSPERAVAEGRFYRSNRMNAVKTRPA